MNAANMTERQALDAAIKRAVSSAPFVRSISAALAGVLTPDDGTCVLPPMCQQSRKFKWENSCSWNGSRYEISDNAGYELSAHKSSHEAFRDKWIVSEERLDGEGVRWHRTYPLMVMDDFGNLVAVE